MNALTRSIAPVLNVLGAVVAIFAVAMLVPLGAAVFAGEQALVDYDTAFLITFLGGASGLDVVPAFTAVVACLNNIGPGLNQVGPIASYAVLNDFETWVCAFAMLIGRLELMSVLVLFTPAFWRK